MTLFLSHPNTQPHARTHRSLEGSREEETGTSQEWSDDNYRRENRSREGKREEETGRPGERWRERQDQRERETKKRQERERYRGEQRHVGLMVAFCVPSSAECLLYGRSMVLHASCLSSDSASTMFCVLKSLQWPANWTSSMVSVVKGRSTSLLHRRFSEHKH